LKKISKFRTNTIERATEITDEAKKQLDPDEFDYIAEKSTDWEEQAIENITGNREKVISNIENADSISGGVQAHEAAIISKDLLDEAAKTGNWDKAKAFIKTVASKTRETARALKGTDTAWQKSPAGAVQKATREVDNFTDDVLKQNPNVKNKVDSATKKAKGVIDKAKKERDKIIDEAVSNVIKDGAGDVTSFPEVLKNKMIKGLQPKTTKESSFIKRMIKDLFEESKESIKYADAPLKPDTDITDLAASFELKKYRKEIKQTAIKMLKDEMALSPDFARMLADNPQVMQDILKYFETGNIAPASKKLLNSVINKRLKSGDINKWVKDFYATGRAAREDFINSIVKETGLSGPEAKALKKTLYSNLKARTKSAKDSLLESIMSPKQLKKQTKATKKLTELTNIGLLENKKFTDRIGEKISPLVKRLLSEQGIKLDDVVRLSVSGQRKERGKILREVFRNTRIDDKEINNLLGVINDEFNKLAKNKRKAILNRMAGFDAQGNLIERSVPKGDLDKLIEKINLGLYDDTTDDLIRQMILEKSGLPQLNDKDIKFIYETMESAAGKDEFSEQYLESIAKINKLIAEKTPATIGQKVRSIGFQSMLGNISSNVTNIGGNILNVAPEIVMNPLKRGLDVAIGGKRVTGKIDKGLFLKGLKKGMRSVKRDMLGGKDFKDFKSFGELYEAMANPIDASVTGLSRDKFVEGSRLAFDNNPLRVTENIVSSALSAGDRPFEQAFYDSMLDVFMKSEGVTVPTKEMREAATEIAKGVTFKGDNFISTALTTLKDVPTMVQRKMGIDPKALKGLKKVGWSIPEITANTLLPFVKTPANIVKRTLEYSPAGLAEGVLKLAANRGGMSLTKKREIIDVLSRGILGSGLMGLGFGLGKAGMITGDRPDNYRASSLGKQAGKQYNALNIGGKNIDLKKFYPFTAPIVSGASLAMGDSKGTGMSYLESSAGAINNLTEISLLSTVSKAAEMFNPTSHKDKSKIMVDLAMQLPSQLTPSLIKKITHWSDDYERNLTGDSLIEHAWNNYVGRLPIASEKFPARVDWKGDPVPRYGGRNTLLNVMANPYKVTDVKSDPILDESLRLYNISGESSTLLPRASDTHTLGKNAKKNFEGYKLTVKDQNKYQKLLGSQIKDALTGYITQSKYKNKDDEGKAKDFKKKLSDAREKARKEMIDYLKTK
jgi:hypothetical protein